MSRGGVNRRWLLAADAELPWVPILLAAWQDLPRLAPDATSLAVLREILVAWQASPAARDAESRFVLEARAIVEQTKLSERAVRNAIRALEDAGLLCVRAAGRFREYDVLPLLRAVRHRHDVPLSSRHVVPESPENDDATPAPGAATPARGAATPARGAAIPARGAGVQPRNAGQRERENLEGARAHAETPSATLPLATQDGRRAALAAMLDVVGRGRTKGLSEGHG